MGDVLVYVESPVNERLLAFARPLADAAGGELVALVASGEPAGGDGLSAADVVLEVSHPALSPYLPEAHQGARGRDPGAGPTSSCSRTPRLATTSPPRPRPQPTFPFVGYCVELALQDGEGQAISGIYGGQFHATVRTPLPGCLRSTPRPCTKSLRLPAGANVSSSPRPPSSRA